MSLSSWKERAKLGGLAVALLFCLATIFSSAGSFGTDGRDLPRLRPRSGICKEYASSQSSTIPCQRAVKAAYRRINGGGGCLPAEQQVVLCEIEWCGSSSGGGPPSPQCQTECQSVRGALQQCIQSRIQESLQAFGLLSKDDDDDKMVKEERLEPKTS